MIGFVGTAYITFVLVVLRYFYALPVEYFDNEEMNPVDILVFGWVRRVKKRPASTKWANSLRDVRLMPYTTENVY